MWINHLYILMFKYLRAPLYRFATIPRAESEIKSVAGIMVMWMTNRTQTTQFWGYCLGKVCRCIVCHSQSEGSLTFSVGGYEIF